MKTTFHYKKHIWQHFQPAFAAGDVAVLLVPFKEQPQDCMKVFVPPMLFIEGADIKTCQRMQHIECPYSAGQTVAIREKFMLLGMASSAPNWYQLQFPTGKTVDVSSWNKYKNIGSWIGANQMPREFARYRFHVESIEASNKLTFADLQKAGHPRQWINIDDETAILDHFSNKWFWKLNGHLITQEKQ